MYLNSEKYGNFTIIFWKFPYGSRVTASAWRNEKVIRTASGKTKEDAFDAIKRLLH